MKLFTQINCLTEQEIFEQDYESRVRLCEQVVSECTEYDQEILRYYIQLGSFRAVERELKIDHCSVYVTIKRIREKVKERLCA